MPDFLKSNHQEKCLTLRPERSFELDQVQKNFMQQIKMKRQCTNNYRSTDIGITETFWIDSQYPLKQIKCKQKSHWPRKYSLQRFRLSADPFAFHTEANILHTWFCYCHLLCSWLCKQTKCEKMNQNIVMIN